MLDVERPGVDVDMDENATALTDETNNGHRWLIDAQTSDIAFRNTDTHINGENPIDLDELNLLPIDPLSSPVISRP